MDNKIRAAVALLAVASSVSVTAQTGNVRDAIVATDAGQVRGLQRDGVYRFLGVPYAAPPVGELRWRPTAPAPHHDGVVDATKFSNVCPQNNTIGVFSGPPGIDEDCLYLNVFTTGLGKSNGAPRPVIVWFHGGGNFTGAASDYDGVPSRRAARTARPPWW